ncbi:DEAD/DEAH box helicase [Desulfovibrio desulfuricans]|uniref:DEAD/DEAH box helicase n=1 Tax=Desulfovibrio desulfuricans TaxID=876 RepID=UPI001C02155F|nr:DEAD/DEAH box helicase family protein [Desulfovibrio desulfuricans]MBT9748160.1 type III restriction endonuclease subunit R [Desulfovibrio desulfuricans]
MSAVQAIANALALRSPQREALDILSRVWEAAPLGRDANFESVLDAVQAVFPHVRSFDRDFPSLCFALATGVGKTRLMGAFIAWLYREHGIRNFFVIAPNLTIYDKLKTDFSPNTPKYVFEGIMEFAAHPPLIITGDNYEDGVALQRSTRHEETAQINIFNIAKITARDNKDSKLAKDDAGRTIPRMRRLNEYIGESYFSYLAGLDDLVVLMDESHRYRADAGLAAINDLKPLLGLELTATPQVERGAKQAEPFGNVIYNYPLAAALRDGFVKEPAVATRQNFHAENYSADGLERIKLEDGVRIHEHTKVELEIYARNNDVAVVKPFMLVVAQDTTHADELQRLLESTDFFEGQYAGKVITVHSKSKGSEGDDIVAKLLTVESPSNPVEIVVHVNMLKEGWDVTNLYTIVPLRAANSRTLVEQSIGRGLRLPYGRRTGVPAVDRLTIVSHDRFKDIVDHANDPDSVIRKQVVLGVDIPLEGKKAVTAPTTMDALLTGAVPTVTEGGEAKALDLPPLPPSLAATAKKSPFSDFTGAEARVAAATLEVIRQYERLEGSHELQKPEIQKEIARKVSTILPPVQGSLLPDKVNTLDVVEKTTRLYQELSIDIPRIVVVPAGEVVTTWQPFTLDLSAVRLQPVALEILIQHLHDQGQRYLLETGFALAEEKYPENYIVRGLMQYVPYDENPELWRDLARQMVHHLRSYLDSEDAVVNVLQYHQKTLVDLVYSQMRNHKVQKAARYEAHVTKGFTTLKQGSYTIDGDVRDFRISLPEGQRSQIRSMLFDTFTKCLFTVQKFDSDPERRFAVILENDPDVLKWCRPNKNDLRIYYSHEEQYEPDFVVENTDCKYLCEPKRADQIATDEVQAKARAAITWCQHATEHAQKYGGKPWRYLLVAHDRIQENMTLKGLEG